jgi:hypothetical protein
MPADETPESDAGPAKLTARELRRQAPLISSRREWFMSVGTIGLLTLTYFIAPLGHDDPLPVPVASAAILVTVGIMAFLIGNQVRLTFVDSTSIRLARLTTLLSITIFAFALGYFILERSSPGEVSGLHTRLDSLYFTLVTIGTIGYGDIHPEGQAARAISCVQIIFNAIYIGALIRIILFQVGERAKERQVKPRGTTRG